MVTYGPVTLTVRCDDDFRSRCLVSQVQVLTNVEGLLGNYCPRRQVDLSDELS